MMTHPHGERLSAYLDGMLDTWQMRQVAQHLGTCAHCRSLHRSLRETKVALRRMPSPEPPDADFWVNTYRRLRTEGEARPAGRSLLGGLASHLPVPQRRLATAFAAVAVLGAAIAGPFLTHTAATHPPLLAAGSVDSVDLSSLVRAHTESAARQPLADPDRQTMIGADTDDGARFTDSTVEAAGDEGSLTANAVH